MHSWPSGLRRCVQVAVYSYAWVRIPLNANNKKKNILLLLYHIKIYVYFHCDDNKIYNVYCNKYKISL